MILGTAEEVRATYQRRRATKISAGTWPQRRDASTVEDEFLWPNGIIPYVIDPGFNEGAATRIRKAIEEWNAKTVITLVERTTELDFVRFRPEGPYCGAALGRLGGEQPIWLISRDGCSFNVIVHEIGHAVGLNHEHQREDRDAYVFVLDFEAYGYFGWAYEATFRGGGPYDYASIMHASYTGTFPPGIPVGPEGGAGGLSFGDIDGVARMYGKPPTATTISTNPPGLAVIVDDETVTTPATFNWSPGSKHVLEASSPQIVAGKRFLFGRWNDGGFRKHTVEADAGKTWIEANYIVQQRLVACADPAEEGGLRIRPEADDGYYTISAPVEIEASAAPGISRAFVHWNARGGLSRRADRRSGWSAPSRSSNPTFGLASQSSSTGSEYSAFFSAKPLFRIDSNVDGIAILVNNDSKRLPWAFPADEYPEGITVDAPVTVPEETDLWTDVRYRFNGWSDGGARAHSVAVPATGGSVSLDLTREYRLRIRVHGRRDDEVAVSISPPSEDGFYAAGTQVQVTAVPNTNEHFAGWAGEVSGSEPVQTVVMDAPISLEAFFTSSEPLRPNERKEVVLAARNHFRLYGQATGWHVLVPPDASELTVRFRSTSAAEVDLHVRRGRERFWESSSDGQPPRIFAEFSSTTAGASETITIRRDSMPPMTNDVYFIGLAVPPIERQLRGTLSVAVRRTGIVQAEPPGFTFVAANGSPPAPQTVRLTHETADPVRYRIESRQHWISASPNDWVQTGNGTAEIVLSVNGAGLLPGTHKGALSVLEVRALGAASLKKPTGIEIPVAFAVLPSSVSRRVNGARITSRPQNGDTYGAGEGVEVSVDFVDSVKATGKPTLAVGIGNRTRQVEWDSERMASLCGEEAKSLIFRYGVQAEDQDADGISLSENALALNGGSIETAHGTPANLALAPIASDAEHKVDGSKLAVPEVSRVRIQSSPQDGAAYDTHERIVVVVTFSGGVAVTGSPTLALTLGASTRLASVIETRDRFLWFRYTVQAGDTDADGISILAGALALNGGSIRSAAGADASLDLGSHAIVNDAGHKVDGSKLGARGVSLVRIQSSPHDGAAYGTPERILVLVTFSGGIAVTGSPTLALTVGASTRLASVMQTRDRYLWFHYTVQAGDTDADGISIHAGALALNGGSIRSAAGADASLGLGSHAIVNDAGHKVDGSKLTAPEVSGVWIHSRPRDGAAYGAGEEIWGQVGFSYGVEVTGSPTLALTVGASTRVLPVTTQSDRRYLSFGYTVQAGDTDADGISILAGALALNGGSIRSAAGADAMLGLGSHAVVNDPGHKVDGD